MKQKMYSKVIVVIAIVGASLIVLISCTSVFRSIDSFMNMAVSWLEYSDASGFEYHYDNTEPYEDSGGNSSEEYSEQDLEGVDASNERITDISSYTEDGTAITVEKENYTLKKRINGNSGIVYFDLKYPELSGIDAAYAENVNKVLKDMAYTTADSVYLNVGADKSLDGNGTYLVSEVTYNITYLSDDWISVVYEDNYCMGDPDMKYIDLRVCNINLKDGKSYELKDIIKGNSELAEDYQFSLDDRYQTNDVIYGIPVADYEKMLEGGTTEDGSCMGFFRTKDGLELFVSFDFYYEDNTGYVNGWFRVPYEVEDVKKYKSDSAFWESDLLPK